MPQALLNIDWNLGQELFARGLPYSEIAERLAVSLPCVRQRAHRYQWKCKRELASRDASCGVSCVTAKPLTERARDARETLGREVEQQLALLAQHPPATVEELKDVRQGRASLVRSVAQAARDVFGWDAQEQPLLQVGTVSSMTIQLQARPQADYQAVIDVESSEATTLA